MIAATILLYFYTIIPFILGWGTADIVKTLDKPFVVGLLAAFVVNVSYLVALEAVLR